MNNISDKQLPVVTMTTTKDNVNGSLQTVSSSNVLSENSKNTKLIYSLDTKDFITKSDIKMSTVLTSTSTSSSTLVTATSISNNRFLPQKSLLNCKTRVIPYEYSNRNSIPHSVVNRYPFSNVYGMAHVMPQPPLPPPYSSFLNSRIPYRMNKYPTPLFVERPLLRGPNGKNSYYHQPMSYMFRANEMSQRYHYQQMVHGFDNSTGLVSDDRCGGVGVGGGGGIGGDVGSVNSTHSYERLDAFLKPRPPHSRDIVVNMIFSN